MIPPLPSSGGQLRGETDRRKRAGRRLERARRTVQPAAAVRGLLRRGDERMRLRVEHICESSSISNQQATIRPAPQRPLTVVQADVVRVVEGEVEVLEHLREPEALHVVDEARVRRVDVVDGRVRDSGRLQVCLDALHGVGGAVEVLDVAREAVRVEVGLEHLGAHVVVRGRNVEPMPVVKSDVACAGRRARVRAVARDVGE